MSGRAGPDDRRASELPRETKFRDSTTAAWLLGVILLLLVLWVASLLIVTDDGAESTVDAPPATARTIASSQAFSAWVRDTLPTDPAALDDRTTLDALRRLNIAQGSVAARVAPDLAPRLATVDSLLLEFDADLAAGVAADSRRHVAVALSESWDILADLQQRLPATMPAPAETPPAAERDGMPQDVAPDHAVAEAGHAAAAVDPAASPDAFRQQVLHAVRAMAAGLAAVAGAAGAP